jgi:hypothetical protein
MLTIYIPLIFAIVGALMYLAASTLPTTREKIAELARLGYFAGLLAWLLHLAR